MMSFRSQVPRKVQARAHIQNVWEIHIIVKIVMYGRWMNGVFGKVLQFCEQKNEKMSGSWKNVSILGFQNYFGMYSRWMNGFFGKVLEFCECFNFRVLEKYRKQWQMDEWCLCWISQSKCAMNDDLDFSVLCGNNFTVDFYFTFHSC